MCFVFFEPHTCITFSRINSVAHFLNDIDEVKAYVQKYGTKDKNTEKKECFKWLNGEHMQNFQTQNNTQFGWPVYDFRRVRLWAALISLNFRLLLVSEMYMISVSRKELGAEWHRIHIHLGLSRALEVPPSVVSHCVNYQKLSVCVWPVEISSIFAVCKAR